VKLKFNLFRQFIPHFRFNFRDLTHLIITLRHFFSIYSDLLGLFPHFFGLFFNFFRTFFNPFSAIIFVPLFVFIYFLKPAILPFLPLLTE